MDEVLIRQLTRQLKLLNFWITLFGTLVLITLLIIGFFIFKLVSFTHHTADKVDNLQNKVTQSLNVKQKVCDTKTVGGFLDKQTKACN